MTPLTEAEIRTSFVNCSQGEARRLRVPVGRQNMCALCGTVHSTTDVALMVAPRPGASGRNGNTVGEAA